MGERNRVRTAAAPIWRRMFRALAGAWQTMSSAQEMKLVFKISWRNLLRHKGKSLIIGTIFVLGSFVMTAGNAVVTGMESGLRENIVNRFLGHVVLVSTNLDFDNVMDAFLVKPLVPMAAYSNVKQALGEEKYVAGFLPAARGFALVASESAQPSLSGMIGVDFAAYQRFFGSNVQVLVGRGIADGERGYLATAGSARRYFNQLNQRLLPEGTAVAALPKPPLDDVPVNERARALSDWEAAPAASNVVFLGFSDNNSSQDVRVAVRGIFRYRQLGKVWEQYDLIDIESFRECFNYVTGRDAKPKIDAERRRLLTANAGDLDSMFNQDATIGSGGGPGGAYDLETLRAATKRTPGASDLDAGSYNMVFVKVKDGLEPEAAKDRLNAMLRAARLDARAITWREAAGQVGDMATIIRWALFGFVTLIFLVAAIVITNTLSMSAIERTGELGMMRAVGAQKNFISVMFGAETATLAVIFGTIGMAAGAAVVLSVAGLKMGSDDYIVQLFFGGDVFRPTVTAANLATGVLQLVVVSVVAVIYPVFVARRITPLDAIARD